MSSDSLTMYHVSFVAETDETETTTHTVSASDEDAALLMAEGRPDAPDQYDRVEVRPV